MRKTTRDRRELRLQPLCTIYHPKGDNTGIAMAMRLNPAEVTSSGSIQFEFARQATIGTLENGGTVFPTFDWDHKTTLRLSPIEAAETLRCLRGMTESINDGAGFIHKSAKQTTRLTIMHQVEPMSAMLFIVKTVKANGDENDFKIALNPSEVMMVETAISASMGRVCFGD